MDSPAAGTILPTSSLSGPQQEAKGRGKVRLSIFSRLALGSLAMVVVMGGLNLYALLQLRQLTALSTRLVSYHYPAIEGAKRLTTSLYAQLRSEKKFLAVRDNEFVANFKDEVQEFARSLASLRTAETSDEGRKLLQDIDRLQEEYKNSFMANAEQLQNFPEGTPLGYEARRDILVDRITSTLQAFIRFHEGKVGTGISDSRASSARAEAVIQQLILAALLLGLGFAGIASYTILRPLRRLQTHIQKIGQGQFGTTFDVEAPSDLVDLVRTVNWMAKKLQELDDMKSEFLAHVSHELRTPLASVQEGTQLLLDEIPGSISQDQRKTLQIMSQSSRRLIHLISTLLDLSKMEAGMMEYRIILTDLKGVAEQSVSKVRLLADSKRVQILTEAPAGRIWAPVDGARIEQVLDNLLSNAVKFSPEGGVVHLRIEPEHKAGVLRVSVSDTGPGIDPEDLPHLFERFYQGRRQARGELAGSGLGLALAKKIVEAHRGRIWVESELGKGTTIHFVLRLARRKGAQ